MRLYLLLPWQSVHISLEGLLQDCAQQMLAASIRLQGMSEEQRAALAAQQAGAQRAQARQQQEVAAREAAREAAAAADRAAADLLREEEQLQHVKGKNAARKARHKQRKQVIACGLWTARLHCVLSQPAARRGTRLRSRPRCQLALRQRQCSSCKAWHQLLLRRQQGNSSSWRTLQSSPAPAAARRLRQVSLH